jgi:hypothetical protein
MNENEWVKSRSYEHEGKNEWIKMLRFLGLMILLGLMWSNFKISGKIVFFPIKDHLLDHKLCNFLSSGKHFWKSFCVQIISLYTEWIKHGYFPFRTYHVKIFWANNSCSISNLWCIMSTSGHYNLWLWFLNIGKTTRKHKHIMGIMAKTV